jgi:hypothetical protein
MVEIRKQKVETREGTTTEPDSEIYTDYSADFEEDEPATSVNTTIVQLRTDRPSASLSTPSLRSPQVNGKQLGKSASVQMVETDIETEEREMRPAPHEGPNEARRLTVVSILLPSNLLPPSMLKYTGNYSRFDTQI